MTSVSEKKSNCAVCGEPATKTVCVWWQQPEPLNWDSYHRRLWTTNDVFLWPARCSRKPSSSLRPKIDWCYTCDRETCAETVKEHPALLIEEERLDRTQVRRGVGFKGCWCHEPLPSSQDETLLSVPVNEK